MIKYNKKYRVIGEFDKQGKLIYSDKKEDTPTFIYCYNGQINISRYSNDELRIDIAGTGIAKKILDQLNEHKKIKVISGNILDKEGVIIVKEEAVDTIFKICKAKRQRNTPVSIINEKDNLNYFKRSQSKFDTRK